MSKTAAILGGLALAGLAGLAGWQYVRAERALGAVKTETAKFADYRAAQERQAREALQQLQAKQARTEKLRQEAIDAEHIARVSAQADADRLRAGNGRLQRYATDLATSLGDRARDTAAAGGGKAARATTDLLADVLGRLDEAAGTVVLYADSARIAGQLCERSYGALRP